MLTDTLYATGERGTTGEGTVRLVYVRLGLAGLDGVRTGRREGIVLVGALLVATMMVGDRDSW